MFKFAMKFNSDLDDDLDELFSEVLDGDQESSNPMGTSTLPKSSTPPDSALLNSCFASSAKECFFKSQIRTEVREKCHGSNYSNCLPNVPADINQYAKDGGSNKSSQQVDNCYEPSATLIKSSKVTGTCNISSPSLNNAANKSIRDIKTGGISVRKKKFPGPAGMLPLLSDRPHEIINNMKESSHMSPSIGKCVLVCSQDTTSEFAGGLWIRMLQDIEIDSKCFDIYNLRVIQKRASLKGQAAVRRISFLPAMIHCIDVSHANAVVVLKDPFGRMNGTIGSSVVKEHVSFLHPGAVLILHNVTLLSPLASFMPIGSVDFVGSHYLNITVNSMLAVYYYDDSCGIQVKYFNSANKNTIKDFARNPRIVPEAENVSKKDGTTGDDLFPDDDLFTSVFDQADLWGGFVSAGDNTSRNSSMRPHLSTARAPPHRISGHTEFKLPMKREPLTNPGAMATYGPPSSGASAAASSCSLSSFSNGNRNYVNAHQVNYSHVHAPPVFTKPTVSDPTGITSGISTHSFSGIAAPSSSSINKALFSTGITLPSSGINAPSSSGITTASFSGITTPSSSGISVSSSSGVTAPPSSAICQRQGFKRDNSGESSGVCGPVKRRPLSGLSLLQSASKQRADAELDEELQQLFDGVDADLIFQEF